MNAKLLKNLFMTLVIAIFISSCSSANDCTMASDEGVAKVKELVKKHVDINECKIYRIEWKEDRQERKLENVLSQISVDYIDKKDNDYNLTINYTDGEFVPEEPRKGKFASNSYKYTTAIEIDGMNAEEIRHNIASGGELVILQEEGEQYEFKSVEKYMDINECKIYRIEWKEDRQERKLENVLSQISVDYIDKKDNDYNLTINYTDGEFVPEEPRKGKFASNSYKYTTAIEIDGMNAEEIRHNIASGGELVILQEEGEQYEFKSVEKYMLYMRPVPKDYEDHWKKWGDDKKKEYRQLRQMFELNFIKKDEQKEVRGRHVWTNYYTVPFETNEAGEVEIEQ